MFKTKNIFNHLDKKEIDFLFWKLTLTDKLEIKNLFYDGKEIVSLLNYNLPFDKEQSEILSSMKIDSNKIFHNNQRPKFDINVKSNKKKYKIFGSGSIDSIKVNYLISIDERTIIIEVRNSSSNTLYFNPVFKVCFKSEPIFIDNHFTELLNKNVVMSNTLDTPFFINNIRLFSSFNSVEKNGKSISYIQSLSNKKLKIWRENKLRNKRSVNGHHVLKIEVQ